MQAYSRGLNFNPCNVTLLSNRAAAAIKLKEWRAALEDCNVALREDPHHAKCLLRRAKAHQALGSHILALADIAAMPASAAKSRPVQELKRAALVARIQALARQPTMPVERTPLAVDTDLDELN